MYLFRSSTRSEIFLLSNPVPNLEEENLAEELQALYDSGAKVSLFQIGAKSGVKILHHHTFLIISVQTLSASCFELIANLRKCQCKCSSGLKD